MSWAKVLVLPSTVPDKLFNEVDKEVTEAALALVAIAVLALAISVSLDVICVCSPLTAVATVLDPE